MATEVEYEQLVELLELKKHNVLLETLERLSRELSGYAKLSQLVAHAKSLEATDELGLTMPPVEENGHEEMSPIEELARRQRLLMDAMRATIYVAANRLKQYSQQEKDARPEPEEAETTEE